MLKPSEVNFDNIKFEKKYIAFVDVLGFTAMVNSSNDEKLEAYFHTIDATFKTYDRVKPGLEKFIISDSIILIADDSEEAFENLLIAIRYLQSNLAVENIWVRGGVSFGDVYYQKQKNIIVGKGYIKAYLLEQEAIYPRIIIDPGILKKLELTLKDFYGKFNEPPSANENYSNKLIHEYNLPNLERQTLDDAIFVSYAQNLIIKDLANSNEYESSALKSLIYDLKSNLYGEQKHYHKYLWVKKYFSESFSEIISQYNDLTKAEFVRKAALEFDSL